MKNKATIEQTRQQFGITDAAFLRRFNHLFWLRARLELVCFMAPIFGSAALSWLVYLAFF